jgi:hypothetical protein
MNSPELEKESANLATIEKLLGRFLIRGGRGEQGGSPGDFSLARGGLQRRRHGEEEGGSEVFFCSFAHRERRKGGGMYLVAAPREGEERGMLGFPRRSFKGKREQVGCGALGGGGPLPLTPLSWSIQEDDTQRKR